MTHAERLIAWRKAQRWGQAQAAEYWGVSVEGWGKWERGERPVPNWLTTCMKRFDGGLSEKYTQEAREESLATLPRGEA